MKKRILISPFIELNKYNKIVISLNLEWFSYLNKLKLHPIIANPQISISNQLNNINCIIITGGGDIFKIKKKKENLFRDKFETKLIKESIKKKIPIIAICRGFQLIHSLFDKNIKNLDKVKNHRNKNHFIIFNKKNIFSNKSKIKVNSYHNIIIKKLNKEFEKIAHSDDQNIEIAYSKKNKIIGLMLHPERYNKDQNTINKIIKRFINFK